MALDAGSTSEASDQPPAACSQAKDVATFVADHKLDFSQSILGS